MVTDVETRATSVTTRGKVARACDACTRRLRASWFCPADDAFLCQSCDASIHSANQLAKRHVRVRLQSPAADKTTPLWYEGFKRKARTPRNKGSNDPLVPELGGGEEEEDGFFSFSSTYEKEEDGMNCCVPVLDPFSSEMVTDDGVNIATNSGHLVEIEKAIMDDEGLIGLLDMDLGELPMDMERLLEEDQQSFLGVKELNDIGVKGDENIGFETNCMALKRVKNEQEEEDAKCENGVSTRESDGEESEYVQDRKTNLLLRLDYEAVISTWGSQDSPWITGVKPEFNLHDYWGEFLLGGNKSQSHVKDWFDDHKTVPHGQRSSGGGLDGEREARMLRYKEKRRSRLFTKKIRYEVRKLNAEQRPRIKGRFVKRTSLFT